MPSRNDGKLVVCNLEMKRLGLTIGFFYYLPFSANTTFRAFEFTFFK